MPYSEYFKGPYLSAKREIRRISYLEEKALQTLLDTHCAGRWPYKVMNNAPLGQPAESMSTVSMVTFALASHYRFIGADFTVLANPQAPILVKAKGVLQPALEYLFEHLREDKCQAAIAERAPCTTTSQTYGENDPLTLAWLAAILSAIVAENSDFGKLVAGAIQGNEAKVSNFILASCHSLRLRLPSKTPWWFHDKALGESKAHALPDLRVVQLGRLLVSTREKLTQALKLSRDVADFLEETCEEFEREIESRSRWFMDRLHEQLAYASMQDALFDAAELACSAEGALLCDQHMSTIDAEMVNKLFEVLLERQKSNPYWRPLKPLIINERGFALLPLSVEIVNSVLRTCDVLNRHGLGDKLFSGYVSLFSRYFDWVEQRVTRGRTNEHIDFTGWHSEHLQVQGTVHIWETSQILLYLGHYKRLLQQHIARTSLDVLNIKRKDVAPPSTTESAEVYWNRECKKKEPIKVAEIGAYGIVENTVIKPRTTGAGIPNYSLVAYGPPGTGKTTLAADIAAALHWPLIEVTPSDFVAAGQEELELRASCIFQALGEQEDTVILLDEIDRLMMYRESKMYLNQSDMFQVLTPGMLPKLKNLRELNRSIFIIATNYIDRLDPAAIRAGRIDRKVLVGPPDLGSRVAILKTCIKNGLAEARAQLIKNGRQVEADNAIVDEAAALSVWATFGELKTLAVEAIAETNDRTKVDYDALNRKLALKAQQFRPAINPQSYHLDRFRPASHKYSQSGVQLQELFLEFAVLAYLAAEVSPRRTLNDQEKNAFIVRLEKIAKVENPTNRKMNSDQVAKYFETVPQYGKIWQRVGQLYKEIVP